MKKILIGLLVGAVLGFGAAALLRHPPTETPAASEPKSAPQGSESPLHLSAARQATAGIVVAAPRSVRLAPEADAFGRVLDPTPYVALVAEEATARASLTASERELARVQKLFAAGENASAQAVEAAEAAAARDRAAVASAQVRLLAGWGRTLAKHADLAQLRDILSSGAALVRIDLLPGTSVDGVPKHVRIALLGSPEAHDVQMLGPAPVADPQVQGASFLGLLRGRTLPAGATLRVTLETGGEPKETLVIPRSAVVYDAGRAWVYVLKNDTFARREVTLGRTLETDVAVVDGIQGDDKVATQGAAQLLSAERVTGESPEER